MLEASPLSLNGHEAAVYALAAWGTHDVLSGGGDGYLVHWSLSAAAGDPAEPTGKVVAQLEERIFCLCVLSGARNAAVGTLSGDLYFLALDGTHRTKQARRWRYHTKGCYGLCALGDVVYSVGGSGRLAAWDSKRGEQLRGVHLDNCRLRGLAYLEEADCLAVGTERGEVHFVDRISLERRATLPFAHEQTVFAVLDRGDYFISAGRDAALRAWAVQAPFAQRGHIPAHHATINALQAGGPGELYTASRDGSIKFWRKPNASLTAAEQSRDEQAWALDLAQVRSAVQGGGHRGSVNALALVPGARRLISAGDDRSIKAWRLVDR